MFRKIAAREKVYVSMKERFPKFFSEFKNYIHDLSQRRTKKDSSGTAHSYTGYLIRAFILAEENSGVSIINPYALDTYTIVNNLRSLYGYDDYNVKEGRFPNSAIRSYLTFLTEKNMITEIEIDNIVDLQTESELSISNQEIFYYKENETREGPIIREQKVLYNLNYRYPRNIYEVQQAKKRANWKCEMDGTHRTFISNATKKPYIEAHHLVPMVTQDLFKYTVDYADNIICLCPNCHRKIHYALDADKTEMLASLYERNFDTYLNHGITMSFEKLLSFYIAG